MMQDQRDKELCEDLDAAIRFMDGCFFVFGILVLLIIISITLIIRLF